MNEIAVLGKENKLIPSINDAPRDSKPYEPFGSAREVFTNHSDEFIIEGAAGTGKSRACLEKLYLCGLKYPGARMLMARKTRESLTQSGMVTFEKHVVPANGTVRFKTQEQQYEFYNGSVLVVGGLDKSSKIMSTDYDLIYVQEATELEEDDWESLTTRCRNGLMPYNQTFGDCNPGSASHWILNRGEKGYLKLIKSQHEDNPVLYDHFLKAWTPQGVAYIGKLDKLTGVRYLRLRKGIWVSAEGMIYEEYDPRIHLINRNAVKIGDDWRKFIAIDFGYTMPFVAQWWAIDNDDNMYRYREIYMTQRTVSMHSDVINKYSKGEEIEAVVCDWDAEDRATLEENGVGTTIPADKAVSVGIQNVKDRLKDPNTGKARIFLLRDSTIMIDPQLQEEYKPTSTEAEIDGYVWSDKSKKETPLKKDDHGCDAMRYAVMYADSYSREYGGIFV